MRFLAIAIILLAAPGVAQGQSPTHASVASADTKGAAALALFQRDAVLNYWALKQFDTDGDIILSNVEAAAAADQFKTIADADSDGRVTPYEYARARDFIVARF